jgi:hypothetical protein
MPEQSPPLVRMARRFMVRLLAGAVCLDGIILQQKPLLSICDWALERVTQGGWELDYEGGVACFLLLVKGVEADLASAGFADG